jgi:hypothetical protein
MSQVVASAGIFTLTNFEDRTCRELWCRPSPTWVGGLILHLIQKGKDKLHHISEPPISWQDRSEIVSRFIRPNDAVLDLGSGVQTLKRFLPSSVRYIPVDCVKVHLDTYVADFDAPNFTLPDKEFSVVACIGLFTHLQKPEALLNHLASAYPGKFIIYTSHVRERRFRFEHYVSDISLVGIFHGQPMFTGVLNLNGDGRPPKRSLGDLICSHTSFLVFANARWALAIRKWKRGGNSAQVKALPAKFDIAFRE